GVLLVARPLPGAPGAGSAALVARAVGGVRARAAGAADVVARGVLALAGRQQQGAGHGGRGDKGKSLVQHGSWDLSLGTAPPGAGPVTHGERRYPGHVSADDTPVTFSGRFRSSPDTPVMVETIQGNAPCRSRREEEGRS